MVTKKKSAPRRSAPRKAKKVRHHAKKNILGMSGKIPVLATGALAFPVSELYTAYQGNAPGNKVNAVVYHASGMNVKTGEFNAQQTMDFWKYPLLGAVGSYAAQKLGAQKVTNKIPVLGKYVRL